MPDAFREKPPSGGEGGIGDGPDIAGLAPPASIDDDSKDDLPDLSPAEFCQQYGLEDVICNLLVKHRFDPIGSLLDVKESTLKSLGFKIGHIAELRWAMKKVILAKYGTMPVRNGEAKYVPEIIGGIGGAGGFGGHTGGRGGTGRAAQIEMEDLFRFRDIRGGIGGVGGAGPVPGVAGLSEAAALAATGAAIAQEGPNISGGEGGAGGSGVLGGSGGLGKAARILAWQVAFFNKIGGGIGGAGGSGLIDGGSGGDGEGNKFPKLLWSIDNETRNWLLPTKLQDFKIRPDLRQLLEEQGFHSVGSLFEAYDTDLLEAQHDPNQQSLFKEGDVSVLTGALRKFVKEQKRKRKENRHFSL
ncbi:hypothetical protein MVEN_00767600 [Mycena venus]|uniref:Uncharacterized protein n=1 Tax=Mycena venus TaxID=2733690 RepID=A0A8H6YFS8_9AGAR|nr:hypothetical protein MVEN_00767600 [Mycena venus]